MSNASGKIGLVGYWDTIAFDEFAGKTIVAILPDTGERYLSMLNLA